MPGQLTVSGLSAGEPAGERIFGPITLVGRAVIGETLVIPLVTGDNTVAVPANAVAAMIVIPLPSSVSVKLRTNKNSSDGGLQLAETASAFVYPFPEAAPTSLILNAASSVASISITFI